MADAGSIYFQALSGLGQNFAGMIDEMEKQSQQQRMYDTFFTVGSQIQLPDPKNPEKTVPLIAPQFAEAYQHMKATGDAKRAGSMEALVKLLQMSDAAPLKAAQLQQAQLANQRVPVQVAGQTFQVPPTQALEATIEAPERVARTEHIKEQTEASKASRAPEATVMMDIGGGNFTRVSVNDLIKHPEFLRDQSAKDLNAQVFASTGLSLPQVAQGWNKRIVNGQLQFEAPVVQQTIDPITQKPVPKYNPDGTPAYELVPNPEYKETKGIGGRIIVQTPGVSPRLTKTTRYQLPEEFTPDVLRLTGTEGVEGAERIKIPPAKPSGATRIVPGSVSASKGERRIIDGQLAEWDGKGWIAVQQ